MTFNRSDRVKVFCRIRPRLDAETRPGAIHRDIYRVRGAIATAAGSDSEAENANVNDPSTLSSTSRKNIIGKSVEVNKPNEANPNATPGASGA